jgi:hypothetical protein
MAHTEPVADIGVLWVPGVANNEDPSESLRRLVDTIVTWLDDWLTHGRGAAGRAGGPSRVCWSTSELSPGDAAPPHIVVTVPCGDGTTTSVMVAVSRWTSSLGSPDKRAVTTWLLRAMPMFALSAQRGRGLA